MPCCFAWLGCLDRFETPQLSRPSRHHLASRIYTKRLFRLKVVADFEGGDVTSDAGLLLLREEDFKLRRTERKAASMQDRRDPISTTWDWICSGTGSFTSKTTHREKGRIEARMGISAALGGPVRSNPARASALFY